MTKFVTVEGKSFLIYSEKVFLNKKNFSFSFSNLHARKIKPIYTIYEVNAISLFETIPPKN